METELLITEIKHLLELEKTKKREKKARGECFNIFSTMHMETDEVYTHSSVIANLLNPKGSHGSGDLYLNLFLQSIPELQELEFNTSTAKVEVEYNIGPINKKYTEGGRIDILIESSDKAIIIENKIYAEDQEKQLYRYREFAESQKYSKYQILYLTLSGKPASPKSLSDIKEDEYTQISYHSNIRDWLSECIEKSATKPLVRETLIQYYNLILKITHQDMENDIKNAMAELCKDVNNAEVLLWINENYEIIIDGILNKIVCPKLEEMAKNHLLELVVYKGKNGSWLDKYVSFSFRKPEWKLFEITFMFEKPELSDLRCGFRYIDKENIGLHRDLYDQLSKMYGGKQSSRWPTYRKCKGYAQWDSKAISKLNDGSLIEMIENDLVNLLKAEELLIKPIA